MDLFPQVDPIPLPAPVWLFKVLHDVTLVLHFYAVHFLVGGLVVAALWAAIGKRTKNDAMLDGANQVTQRLPIVMTFVINLGVPPLLFAQVLYGRGLYTSSVLIGFWWISIIFLVMFAYTLLYVMAKKADGNKAYGWVGLIAIIVVLKIGMIYSSNMTLMLRPEAWQDMYAKSHLGLHLPSGDSTIVPRWLYMMLGSVGVTGLALLYLPARLPADSATSCLLRSWGGKLVSLFTLIQLVFGVIVYRVQPELVRAGVMDNAIYKTCVVIWFATAALMILLGIPAGMRRGYALPIALGAASFVNVLAMVIVRDGIRDVTLYSKGFDVWNRAVAANWSTIILFLILFVTAIVVVGWLAKVLVTAQTRSANYG